jgi:hypothetical protein
MKKEIYPLPIYSVRSVWIGDGEEIDSHLVVNALRG